MIRQTHRPRSGRQFYLATVATALFAWGGQADASPAGFQLAAGSAALDALNTATNTTIDQSSDRAVINWSSFNINPGDHVTFAQPSKNAIAFNVIPAGAGVTNISGTLTANGGVWLFSPGGFVFGAGSSVSTGSFLASTGIFNNTSLNEAMNESVGVNQIQISAPPTSTASIGVDSGAGNTTNATILANDGFVLLNGATITQDGSVTSKTDAVVLDADQGITVNFTPQLTSGPSPVANGLALNDVVATPGVQTASSVESSGSTTAQTFFEADVAQPGSGIINLTGEVIASGMKATGNPNDPTNGYSVILDGESTGPASGPVTSTIEGADANGCMTGSISAASGIFARAGTITTGGWTTTGGALTLQAANAVSIPQYTSLTNTAGPINIDPNGPVDVEGQISSGTSVFIAATQVILGASGSISAGPGGACCGTIATSSPTATVTLQNYATNGDTPVAPGTAGGNIMIGAPLNWSAPGDSGTLTLNAYNSLIIAAPIVASDPTAQVDLNADSSGNPDQDYSFVNGGSLSFAGATNTGQGLTVDGTGYNLIFNQSDLLAINSGPTDSYGNLNGDYALAVPLDFAAGGTATVFTGAPVAPTTYATFTGTFLGLGNTISNLNIQDVTPIGQYASNVNSGTNGAIGLFGFVGGGGTIRDVNLSNASVTGGDGIEAGALAGNSDGTVMNAVASGQVTVGGATYTTNGADNNDYAPAYAGGLIGFSDGQVTNVHSSASVTGGDATAGGLIGFAGGGGSITDSSAAGSVTVADQDVTRSVAGGLVGSAGGDITGSSATGSVAGGTGAIVGGLAGLLGGATVTDSFATGAVKATDVSEVGGFAGEVDGGTVDTSYATGAVTQTVGGANGISDLAGGFVGLLDQQGSITRSYSTGAVQTVGGVDATSITFAGGFAGNVDHGSQISNAYSLGAVTATGSNFSDVGGFAGLVHNSSSAATNATINDVYATGLVTGPTTQSTQGYGFTGGLVGVLSLGGTVENSYWDKGTTGQGVAGVVTSDFGASPGTASETNNTAIGGTTGLSPYAAATYANFDLTGTWTLLPGETRPLLRSEYSTTITNAHQLQLMEMNLGANYTLANDIDASETNNDAAGIWNPANGFVPVGGNPVGASPEAAFTGVFDGQGYTVRNLSITFTTADPQSPLPSLTTDGMVGLFGFVGPTGVIEDVNLANAHVVGGDGMLVGALVGGLLGTVNDASSSGVVTLGNEINTGPGVTAEGGGLVGASAGAITNSSSSASVTGADAFVGGLLGSAGGGAILTNDFATGAVVVGSYPANGVDQPAAGGLIGEASDSGLISGSYATGSVTGGAGADIGGFLGRLDDGSITTSYATGAVTETAGGVTGATSVAGGFIGSENQGSSITQSWASGAVSSVAAATTNTFSHAGGFAGDISDAGTIASEDYALGSVTMTGAGLAGTNRAGGFAGAVYHSADVNDVYATGLVTGASGVVTAGLVAQIGSVDGPVGSQVTSGGTITNSYWDQGTTHQTVGANNETPVGGVITNVNPVDGGGGGSAYAQASYANFDFIDTWTIIPGETRPILQSEYSTTITNAHQLQLMTLNLGASYTLANNIDASETTNPSGVWNIANGFVPVGPSATSSFNGSLNGQGYAITNLTIINTTADHQLDPAGFPTNGYAGLFGVVGTTGSISNLALNNVKVTGGDGMYVGALAGNLDGTANNVSSSGTVTGGNSLLVGNDNTPASVGGLAGGFDGTMLNSSSSATVSGGDAFVGGLIGSTVGIHGVPEGTVTNSFASGSVTTGSSTTVDEAIAGGLIGLLIGDEVDGTDVDPLLVSNSYSTASVHAGGGSVAGGFVGVLEDSQITTSYATGPVTQGASTDFASIAGGFVGYADGSGAKISQSFSSGPVTTAGGTPASNAGFAGGFAGELQGGAMVTNAYSQSSVTNTGGPNTDVGGFAGLIDNGAVASEVLATGAVNGGGGTAGGLVGVIGDSNDNPGAVVNSYWDEGPGATGQINPSGGGSGALENDTGIGGTTEIDPYDPATYGNFDFYNIWSLPSAGFYPELYGASHVLNITVQDSTSVYGNYPIYTLKVNGLQGSDTVASAIQSYQAQALGAPTSSTSGYYNVNDSLAVGDYTYEVGISNVAASSAYRVVYDDDPYEYNGGLSVTPAQLTLYSGGDDKTYDASDDDPNPQLGYSGLVPGDNASLTAHFAQQDVGDEIPIIIDGYSVSDGNEGNNYSVTTVNGTGEIDPAQLTVSLTETDKVYDTTNVATVSYDQYQLNGGFGDVQLAETEPTTGTYGGVNVGSYTVTVNGVTLTGSGLSNYSFDGDATGPGQITPAPLTITAATDNRPYDGDIDSSGMPTVGATPGVDGLYASDTIAGLSQSYVSKNVMGTDKSTLAVNQTGFTITDSDDGNGLGNYNITYVNASGTITPAPLVLTAAFNEKTYNGDTTAAATPTVGQTPGVNGLYSGDSISGQTESYTSKDVNPNGNTLAVDPGSYSITDANGDDSENYSVSFVGAAGIIDPLALTASLTGTVEKTYNTTTDANLAANNYSLSSPINGDDVSLVAPTGPASGTYDNANAGTGKTVTVTGLQLSGDEAEDYSVNSTASGPVGIIDRAPLTITAATDDRPYDGDIDSSGMPTVGSTPGVDGLYTSDNIAGLSQSYVSKNVMGTGGSTLAVNQTGFTITDSDDGDGLGNYNITYVNAFGTITPAPLTLTAAFNQKVYNGGLDAAAAPTVGETPGVDGLFPGDTISGQSESYTSKDVAGANASTLVPSTSGFTISDVNGADTEDYFIANAVNGLGTITQAPLSVTLVAPISKTYNGDADATLTDANYKLNGVIGGDDVNLNDPTGGTYDNRNAGTGKTVTVNGLRIFGDDSEDYSLTSTTAADPVGIIIPAPLTLTAVTDTKTYDGGVTSSGTPTNSALIEGDSLSGLTQSFASKNVLGPNGSTLLVTGYKIDDGNDGGNYAVTLVNAQGTINPAPLTIAAAADTKTYDGTTASDAAPNVPSLLGGDTISGLTQTFGTKNAGAQTLSIAGYTIDDGNGGANYVVTTTTAAGEIDPKTLDVNLIGNVQKAYDGNTNATLTSSNYDLVGVIGGDQVSLNDPASGSYDTPAAGIHKLVTVGGLALSGADEANYVVDGSADGQVGTITAPPQTLQIVVPTEDVTTLGFLSSATDAAAAVQNVITTTTTVVNVFPVGNDNDNGAQGDNLPITGTGNRDLWTGSDDSDQACPPNPTTPCAPSGGSH